MLKVGITGGLGSGKSTASSIFELLDVPVYYADAAAKKLMEDNAELKASIIHHFGEKCYMDGKLNRSHLADLVFNDPAKTALLNSLVHPVTIKDGEEWMLQKARAGSPYAIKEAALLFESGSDKFLDKIIGVSSPENLRIQRVMNRDGLTEKKIRDRMSRQMEESVKMGKCDFILENDEHHLLVPQVVKLHQELLKLSEGSA